MNESADRFRELSWRDRLTAREQAELSQLLAARPELAAEREIEAALNAALRRLPDAPIANNFTARVLAAVEVEAAARGRMARPAGAAFWRWRWLPKFAFVAVLLWGGLVIWEQAREARRADLIESVATVAGVSAMPGVEMLQDFEAIQALGRPLRADEELLALLQ